VPVDEGAPEWVVVEFPPAWLEVVPGEVESVGVDPAAGSKWKTIRPARASTITTGTAPSTTGRSLSGFLFILGIPTRRIDLKPAFRQMGRFLENLRIILGEKPLGRD
jgi:hypothetical protein